MPNNDDARPAWVPARAVLADFGWGVTMPSIFGPHPILHSLERKHAKNVAALINEAYATGRDHGEETVRRVTS